MQKILLGLYGTAGSGKSQKVKLAYEKFKNRHPDAPHAHFKKKWDDEKWDSEEISEDEEILVRVKVGKISVGFASGGDSREEVEYNLHKLREKNCDIIVCTTRTKGGTCEVFMHKDNAQYLRFWMTTCIFQYAVEDPHKVPRLQPEKEQDEKQRQEYHNNIVADLIIGFISDHMD